MTQLATIPRMSGNGDLARDEWQGERLDLLKRTICKDASDDELALFVQVCKRTGLDPFVRQIYAVKRWDRKAQREVMAIQTGIDGYRAVAERTGCYAGSDDPVYDREDAPNPGKATVTVYKIVGGTRVPFSASARWAEYVQMGKDGPSKFWKQMPYLMLGKVAEALALRKAFPSDLSGIYTSEEMSQADSEVADTPKQSLKDTLKQQSGQTPQGQSLVDALKQHVGAKVVCDEASMLVKFGLACDIRGMTKEQSDHIYDRVMADPKFKKLHAKDPQAAWYRLIEKVEAGEYDAR